LEEPSSPTLWQTHGPACCMAHAAAGWSAHVALLLLLLLLRLRA
jgi:hypothetical protein